MDNNIGAIENHPFVDVSQVRFRHPRCFATPVFAFRRAPDRGSVPMLPVPMPCLDHHVIDGDTASSRFLADVGFDLGSNLEAHFFRILPTAETPRCILSITHIRTSVETSIVFRFASFSIIRFAAGGIRIFSCLVFG